MRETLIEKTGYSHKKMAEIALKIKIERAIAQVQGDNPNPDVAIQHPEWVREAQNKKYTELTKSITDKVTRYQAAAIARRMKVARKD